MILRVSYGCFQLILHQEETNLLRLTKPLPALLFALFVIGCAVPRYNYVPVRTEISEPPLGSINIAQVGDNMVRQGYYTEYDAIFLNADVPVTFVYTATRGYYLKKGEDEESEFYLPTNEFESGQIIKAALVDPWQSLQAYKQEQSLCVITIFNVHVCNSDAQYERRKWQTLRSDSFQQTLIYSGKVGNKINISYREFSNSLARPAYTNNVEYDQNESKIIGYRGARMEVIEATNEIIKFKLIQNFNKAQF